jgi:hypothetical protein
LAWFDRFIRQLRRLEWVVFARPPLTAEHVVQYLARYTHRVAISNGRLVEFRDGQVTFRWRDSASGDQQKLMTLTAAEFIRRFLLHVLPRGFVKVRYFGFLSSRNRASGLSAIRLLLMQPAQPESHGSPPGRRCPVCRRGILHLVALLTAAEVQCHAFDTSVRNHSATRYRFNPQLYR